MPTAFANIQALADIFAARCRQDAAAAGPDDLADGTIGRLIDRVTANSIHYRLAANDPNWRDMVDEATATAYVAVSNDELRDALVTTAAVLLRWIEAVDRRADL